MLSKKHITLAALPWVLLFGSLLGLIASGIPLFHDKKPEPITSQGVEGIDCHTTIEAVPQPVDKKAKQESAVSWVDVFPASIQTSDHFGESRTTLFDVDPVQGTCSFVYSTPSGLKAQGGQLPGCINRSTLEAWNKGELIGAPNSAPHFDVRFKLPTHQQVPEWRSMTTSFRSAQTVGALSVWGQAPTVIIAPKGADRLKDKDRPFYGQFADLGDGVYIRYTDVAQDVDGRFACGKDASADDKFATHYEMRKLDGEVVDNSYERGPFSFRRSMVIKGFAKAVSNMCEGDKATVFIPKELAYGDDKRRGGDVVFDIELLDVNL